MTHRAQAGAILVAVGIVTATLGKALAADTGQSIIVNAYASELAAVLGAANRYNPISIREDREFMGAVLRRRDCYWFTVIAGRRHSNKVYARIVVPGGAELVAFWHTHGARRSTNQYFSPDDLRVVRRWRKPFYLADYTGKLKVLVPEQRIRALVRIGKLWRQGVVGQVVYDANGNPLRVSTRASEVNCALAST